MARLGIRLSDETKFNLDNLSAKTGYSSSEIIRKLIDNCDEVNLSLALTKIDDRKSIEIEKIASIKYQNYLLSNLTKNINQIAHYVNSNKENSDKKILVANFQNMIKKINEFEDRLDTK